MSRQITVVTPENIPLTLELAGIGTRFGALLVDLLIQIAVMIACAAVWGIIAAVTSATGLDRIAIAALILSVFLVFFGYFILFESIWNGQTPGKRVFNLRVVRDGGFPVNFFSVAARNLVRIADFLPAGYGAGALSVFFNPQYKRLGDLVAGTLVVKEREVHRLGFFDPEAAKQNPGGVLRADATLPEGIADPRQALSLEEIDVLRRFALRRWEMASDDSERLAYRLMAPLVSRLNISFLPGAAPRYADLVSAIVTAVDAAEAAEEAERQPSR